tara:strand:+ start:3189 stop:3482 length:294 start_codon:yes stop_codon:yes gene_type:complete
MESNKDGMNYLSIEVFENNILIHPEISKIMDQAGGESIIYRFLDRTDITLKYKTLYNGQAHNYVFHQTVIGVSGRFNSDGKDFLNIHSGLNLNKGKK